MILYSLNKVLTVIFYRHILLLIDTQNLDYIIYFEFRIKSVTLQLLF